MGKKSNTSTYCSRESLRGLFRPSLIYASLFITRRAQVQQLASWQSHMYYTVTSTQVVSSGTVVAYRTQEAVHLPTYLVPVFALDGMLHVIMGYTL